jgi:selT/selW/selH-like putative selenoprotein
VAAELKSKFDVDTELFAEGKGIFDVVVDDHLAYSKYETGRFPEENEVARLIESLG